MDSTTKGWSRPREILRIADDQQVWFVSDLHLGDGTPSDSFFGKDRHLIALIERVQREGGVLVVNGDAIDFHQAWSFTRVLRAHQALLGALSRLGREGRLFYVIGNHDTDISLFRDVLSFQVCDELHVGDTLLVRHGYEYDPYITDMLEHGQWHTVVHHAIERWMGSWIRVPMGEFYTRTNRFVFWAAHKGGLVARAAQWIGSRVNLPTPVADELLAHLDFWTWSNLGDSMGIFRPALQHAQTGPWRIIVCGHSHLPGVVTRDGRTYANTGSWTFASSQYLVWDGDDITCHDWLTGRTYGEELYRPMLDGTVYERDFFQWWRESYLGWFRFREGEERRGQMARWASYLTDHQHLAQLRPIPEPPPAPRLEVVHDADRDKAATP